ncbi:MAG: rhodanese [Planctomycetes bacterium]|nr:rhodanese [Planctomycetota bacterium]
MNQLPPHQVAELLAGSTPPRLIDVREQDEWEDCHLAGAELFPLSRIQEWAEDLAASERPLVIYCHHGVRSARVCAQLAALGHREAINLQGGIDRWSQDVDPGIRRY